MLCSPNVDFYSGIVLRALGIPLSMYTVLFAVARTVGWVSQVSNIPSGAMGWNLSCLCMRAQTCLTANLAACIDYATMRLSLPPATQAHDGACDVAAVVGDDRAAAGTAKDLPTQTSRSPDQSCNPSSWCSRRRFGQLIAMPPRSCPSLMPFTAAAF